MTTHPLNTGTTTAALTTLLLAAATLSMPAPAHAARNTTQLKTSFNKCLDVDQWRTDKSGAKVQIWGCHIKSNQQWHYDAERQELRNTKGMCLEVAGKDMRRNGARVTIHGCHGGTNQKWTFLPNGQIRNGGGLCLDVSNPEMKKNGGKVQASRCDGHASQKWQTRKGFALPDLGKMAKDTGQGIAKGVSVVGGKIVGGTQALGREAARMVDGTVRQQKALSRLVACVAKRQEAFRTAVDRKDKGAATRIVTPCMTPEIAGTLRQGPTSSGSNKRFFHTVSIGVGASGIYGLGGNAEGGLIISLDDLSKARFYYGAGLSVGFGAAGGADVIAGISRDRLEAGNNANLSVNASGKYVGGAGVSVTFNYANPFQENVFNGISVSGGAGGGFEVGTINPNWSKVI